MKQISDNKSEQNLLTDQTYQSQEAQNIDNNKLQKLTQRIKDAQYKIIGITYDYERIFTASISNNLKYLAFGGNSKILEIWDLQTLQPFKMIEIRSIIFFCRFTEDSRMLYVRDYDWLYKFRVNHNFKKVLQINIQRDYAYNISCISNNNLLLTSIKCIIKIYQQKQLLRLQAHDELIMGLDCNKISNVFASSDKSIKLWKLNDLTLIIHKQNAHGYKILKLQFIVNNNQLISSDLRSKIKVWSANYELGQLELLFLIRDNIRNLSLDIENQFIKVICHKIIKIFTIKGELIREFHFELDNSKLLSRLIQADSMKSILIYAEDKLFICQIEIN